MGVAIASTSTSGITANVPSSIHEKYKQNSKLATRRKRTVTSNENTTRKMKKLVLTDVPEENTKKHVSYCEFV